MPAKGKTRNKSGKNARVCPPLKQACRSPTTQSHLRSQPQTRPHQRHQNRLQCAHGASASTTSMISAPTRTWSHHRIRYHRRQPDTSLKPPTRVRIFFFRRPPTPPLQSDYDTTAAIVPLGKQFESRAARVPPLRSPSTDNPRQSHH